MSSSSTVLPAPAPPRSIRGRCSLDGLDAMGAADPGVEAEGPEESATAATSSSGSTRCSGASNIVGPARGQPPGEQGIVRACRRHPRLRRYGIRRVPHGPPVAGGGGGPRPDSHMACLACRNELPSPGRRPRWPHEAAAYAAAGRPSAARATRLRDLVTPPCAAVSLVAGAHTPRITGSQPFRRQRIGDRDEPCDRAGSASRFGM